MGCRASHLDLCAGAYAESGKSSHNRLYHGIEDADPCDFLRCFHGMVSFFFLCNEIGWSFICFYRFTWPESLPVPSLPVPSLPVPSLPVPSLPVPPGFLFSSSFLSPGSVVPPPGVSPGVPFSVPAPERLASFSISMSEASRLRLARVSSPVARARSLMQRPPCSRCRR